MSQFRGYKCDKCGVVVDKEHVTSRTTRLDGPTVQGEYDEDLCPECIVVPEGVTMRPLRRRSARKDAADDSGAPAPTAAAAAPTGE